MNRIPHNNLHQNSIIAHSFNHNFTNKFTSNFLVLIIISVERVRKLL